MAKSSFQRLLVFRNKAGIFKQVLVTFIPDLAYLKKHGYDASSNRVLAMQPDFSGYLEYSSREGGLLFVLRLVNGKVFKKYRPAAGAKPSGTGKNEAAVRGLETICTPMYATYCVYEGDPEVEICSEEEYVGDNCETVWV